MTSLDDAYKVAVQGTIEKATREAAFVALADVVKATPVDLGRAQGNWFVDIDQSVERVDDARDQGQAISEGTEAAGRFQITDRKVVLHNSVPYIKRLNDGWSNQAPAGFVEAVADRTAAHTTRKYG